MSAILKEGLQKAVKSPNFIKRSTFNGVLLANLYKIKRIENNISDCCVCGCV